MNHVTVVGVCDLSIRRAESSTDTASKYAHYVIDQGLHNTSEDSSCIVILHKSRGKSSARWEAFRSLG